MGKKTKVLWLIFAFFFHFSFSHSSVIHREIHVKNFSGTTAPRILKFGTNVGHDLLYCVKEKQHAAAYTCIIPLFVHFSSFFCLQLAKIKNMHLQNCFNIPLMAMAGRMWALLTVGYILFLSGIRRKMHSTKFKIWTTFPKLLINVSLTVLTMTRALRGAQQ